MELYWSAQYEGVNSSEMSTSLGGKSGESMAASIAIDVYFLQ